MFIDLEWCTSNKYNSNNQTYPTTTLVLGMNKKMPKIYTSKRYKCLSKYLYWKA